MGDANAPEDTTGAGGKSEPVSWDDLIEDACRAGVEVEQFWSSTPRELAHILDGASWRAEQQEIGLRKQSWLAAHWSRVKRMPVLHKILKVRTERPTPQSERARWLAWADDNNLKVRKAGEAGE